MTRICPICGRENPEPPALSRVDNKTEICSLCGTRHALEADGIAPETQDQIIDKIKGKTPQYPSRE